MGFRLWMNETWQTKATLSRLCALAEAAGLSGNGYWLNWCTSSHSTGSSGMRSLAEAEAPCHTSGGGCLQY